MMIALDTQDRCSRFGFTLLEAVLTSALMSLLVLLLSEAWSGLGRASLDTLARCRLTQEASLAAAALAQDCAGSLPATTGPMEQGQWVGRMLVSNAELWLCFDGGTDPDGTADWASPDTVIVYVVQSNKLVRNDQASGTTFTVARNVDSMTLTELGDAVAVDLTMSYRDVTRTYSIVVKDP